METSFSAADARSALAEIGRALEKCADLDQAVKLRNQAAELLFHIKTAALGFDLLHPATGLKLVAERKAGQLLPAFHLRGGDHRSSRARRKLTLERLELSEGQSGGWQWEGRLPKEDFASYLRRTAKEGKLPSSHGLQRLAKMHVESARLADNAADRFGRIARGLRSLAANGKRFGCIVPLYGTGKLAAVPRSFCFSALLKGMDDPRRLAVCRFIHPRWVCPYCSEIRLRRIIKQGLYLG